MHGGPGLIAAAGGRFAGDIRTVRIEGALNDGQERAIGLPVIYGRADDESISRGIFGTYFVADIVIENTCARFISALVAGYAAPYRLITNPYGLAVDAVLNERFRYFGKCN